MAAVLAGGPVAPLPAADYDLAVELDAVTHRLVGKQQIRWRNASGVAAEELYLHLYLNAFASSGTTFMREHTSDDWDHEVDDGWGWTRIDRLELDDGFDLLPQLEFVRPDDGNQQDFTLARVPLPAPVPAGGVVELHLAFEAQLPELVARTGYENDFHFVGQWFPKLAVFDGDDGWNAHQFHATSEFFADFGTYRVDITVPEGWLVVATGWQIASEPVSEDRRMHSFRAERVHDFAWTAAPPDLMEIVESDFEPGRDVPREWLERVSELLERSPADLELPPLELRLMVPKGRSRLAARTVRAARLAVAWFGLRFGPYPYPQLTIVSPPWTAIEAGGMEYPTLITTGSDPLDAWPPFSWSPSIESLVVHEFGHQYFQGMVASNEFEEAWLDEGLTSYAEASCMADLVTGGLAPHLPAHSPWIADRLQLAFVEVPVTIARYAWQYRSPHAYWVASYSKTAVVLKTLEGLVGAGAMARGLRDYTERFRYRHPTGDDLVRCLGEAAGTDLGGFFRQAVDGDAVADWAVLRVNQERQRPDRGMRWDGRGWVPWDEFDSERSATAERRWQVELELVRRGEFVAPVEVELQWSDGRVERRTWNDERRWTRWRMDSTHRLAQVIVDPDVRWMLETRRADNYWRDRPAAGVHPLWWLQTVGRAVGMAFLRFG